MTSIALTPSQQSAGLSLPGTWRLEPTRAITLRPREDGVLRISHGCVWVTFDGPHGGPPDDHGDHVVGAGEQVRVGAGRRVVLESFDRDVPAYFSWDFAPQPQPVRVSRQSAVSQSWSDLQLALVLGLRAGGRLAAALVAVGAGAVLPRPNRGECPAA